MGIELTHLWCDALPIELRVPSPWEQVVGRKGIYVLVLGAHYIG